jgi:hypothetical protein
MTLFPTTFYFRMAYSESLFLLFCLLAMYGMIKSWNPLWIALVAGAATATRPVGIALLAPFALHVFERPGTRRRAFAQLAVLAPIACWGLLTYMAYQWIRFDDPLAFTRTQIHWTTRELGFFERTLGLLTLEPIRAVYDAESPCYWSRMAPRGEPLLNLCFANPLYVLFTIVVLAVGWGKGWLDRRELALSAMLLLIPLWLQAGRTCLFSQARFAAVIFPVYIVLGHLAVRCGMVVTAAFLSVCAVLLCLYSAMFASWYWFF